MAARFFVQGKTHVFPGREFIGFLNNAATTVNFGCGDEQKIDEGWVKNLFSQRGDVPLPGPFLWWDYMKNSGPVNEERFTSMTAIGY